MSSARVRMATRLRHVHWGSTLQVVKTGLASGLSWGLAKIVLDSSRPYFAPLAAILSVQVTVKESVSRGLQRVIGVVAGILVALLAVHVMGTSAWSIGILVFVSMAIATQLKLGAQGIPQVAISALLVMTIGSSVPGYAVARILDTLLGALVAIVVNALVIPPDFTGIAETALDELAAAIGQVLSGIRDDLIDGLEPGEANRHLTRAREVERALHHAQRAIHQAEAGLQWNYLLRQRKSRLMRLRQAIVVLEHSVSQVRGIARTLFVTLNRDVSIGYGALGEPVATDMVDLLTVMQKAIAVYALLIRGQGQNAAVQLEDLLGSAAKQRRLLLQRAANALLAKYPIQFLDIAAVVSDLEKMSEDLTVSAHLLVPLVTTPT